MWLQGLGLQLPSDTTNVGSIGTITYNDGKVNIEGFPLLSLCKSLEKSNYFLKGSTDIADSFIANKNKVENMLATVGVQPAEVSSILNLMSRAGILFRRISI